MNEIDTKKTNNKNRKNQQNKKLVLWKNKEDLQAPGISD
jgi:hypothetical protein